MPPLDPTPTATPSEDEAKAPTVTPLPEAAAYPMATPQVEELYTAAADPIATF